MSNTTAETLTLSQVRNLHAEARDAGDQTMVDACLELLTYYSPDDADAVARVAAARETIVDAINDAEAQS